MLKPSPVSVGLDPTPINPHSAFAQSEKAALAARAENDDDDGEGGGGRGKAEAREENATKRPLKEVLRGLGSSTFFWLICVQVLLLGTMREIFVTYLSTFLNQWVRACVARV